MTLSPVRLRPLHLAALLLAMAGGAAAQQAQRPEAAQVSQAASRHDASAARDAQRKRIQHERDTLSAARSREEATCYKQFSVTDCLHGVRARYSEALSDLRRQEVSVNDDERREKGAAQRGRVDERIQDQRRDREQRALDKEATPVAPGRRPDPQDAAAQREQAAHGRTAQRQQRAQARDQEAAARVQRATQAPGEQQRYDAKMHQAEQRRLQNERNRAEKPARPGIQPLPVPP